MQASSPDPSLKELTQGFLEHFHHAPTLMAQAPGRLEILGNHTDYNQGTVLSVAIDRYATVAVAGNPQAEDGMACRLHDVKGDSSRTFRLDALDQKRPRD